MLLMPLKGRAPGAAGQRMNREALPTPLLLVPSRLSGLAESWPHCRPLVVQGRQTGLRCQWEGRATDHSIGSQNAISARDGLG